MTGGVLGVPEARHVRIVASLPRLPRPFDLRLAPASAIRLGRRLEGLSPDEHRRLETVEEGFDRARLAGLDDAALVARARAAVAAAPPGADSALRAIWTVRGAEALAIARARGLRAPAGAVMGLPGIDALAGRIGRNWQRPDFGLDGPAGEAAAEAAALLSGSADAGTPLAHWRRALEREEAILRRAAFPPRFGLAAIILSVLAWHLVVEARRASEPEARARLGDAVAAAAAPGEALLGAA